MKEPAEITIQRRKDIADFQEEINALKDCLDVLTVVWTICITFGLIFQSERDFSTHFTPQRIW